MALTIFLIGCAVFFIGYILLLIASFRESVWWGLATLLLTPAGLVFVCTHWREGRGALMWGIAGMGLVLGSLASSSALLDSVEAARQGKPGVLSFLGKEEEKPEVTPAIIDTQRRQIEQMEANFHAQSTTVAQQYKALNAKRSALETDDATAVAAFNVEAAAYAQSNTAMKQLRQQIDTAQVELTRLLDERSRQAARPGAAAGVNPASQGTVIIYTTSRCGWCDHAKEYFAKKGVRYDERNVEKSDSARQEFEKLGGRGVPLILVGNERMDGFDEQRLNQLL